MLKKEVIKTEKQIVDIDIAINKAKAIGADVSKLIVESDMLKSQIELVKKVYGF